MSNRMTSRQFVAIVPLHAPPSGPYVTPGDAADALADSLRGVVLGGYDELVCAWMVQSFNLTSLRVLVSLTERVRAAGMQDAVDVENALRANHPDPRHGAGGRYGVPRVLEAVPDRP